MDSEYIKNIIFCFQYAYETAERDNLVHLCCKSIIDDILKEQQMETYPIYKKIEIIRENLTNKIKDYLLTYNKQEINIGLLYFKALFRSKISNAGLEQLNFETSMRQEEILYLLLISQTSPSRKNNSILNGSKNMTLAFRLAYYYNILIDNIEHYSIQKEKFNLILEKDLSYIFKEGGFYSKEFSDYMDELLFMNLYEMPEDSSIETQAIDNEMKRKGITIERIKNEIDSIIKKYIGFTFKNLRDFISFTIEYFNDNKLFFVMNKEEMSLKLKKVGMEAEFNNIIKTFCVDLNLNEVSGKINLVRAMELRSILQMDDKIIIFPIDLIYNINCFEKFITRKHFIEYLTLDLEPQLKEQLDRELSRYEEKMSTFLSYVLLDVFTKNGYIVPKINNIPIPEIKSIIKVDDKKKTINILNDKKLSGDIDVLAINDSKKEIYNVEIKYYKPLDNLYEIHSLTKNKERDKNVKNPLHRAQILFDNRPTVLKFMGLDESKANNYNIRTIFVTPRPDYWMKENSRNVEYYEWVEFIDSINKKLL